MRATNLCIDPPKESERKRSVKVMIDDQHEQDVACSRRIRVLSRQELILQGSGVSLLSVVKIDDSDRFKTDL